MGGGSSPLERAILGILHRYGPATAYGIRKIFERSPSSHWSGSAGAIYPAMRRLDAAGLVEGTPVPDDRRGTQSYTLTHTGRETLQGWLTSSIPDDEARYSFDPIRLRILFMDSLSLPARRRLVDGALRALADVREGEEAFGAEMSARGAAGAARANRGARLVLDARIRWLTEIADELDREAAVAAPTEQGTGEGEDE